MADDPNNTVRKIENRLLLGLIGGLFLVICGAATIIYGSITNRLTALETKVEANTQVIAQIAALGAKQSDVIDRLNQSDTDRKALWEHLVKCHCDESAKK